MEISEGGEVAPPFWPLGLNGNTLGALGGSVGKDKDKIMKMV